jgi:hypothetical protein
MKKVKTILAIALALLSAYIGLNGLTIFVSTSGVVQGSQFGILVTIANQISLLMLWLSLFAFWKLVPSGSNEIQG